VRHHLRRLLYLVIPVVALALPASVAAFPLTNCTATLTSYRADGTVLSTATNGADDATQDNPLIIEPDGSVGYDGTSGSIVFGSFTWSVNFWGLIGGLEGTGTNDGAGTTATGSIDVSDALPFPLMGTFYVTGSVTDNDSASSCEGSGWIQIEGNAFSTPQFWVGVLFAVIGLLAMIWAASGHFWAGLLGGILAGLGVAVLLVTFGLMFLGSWTPAIVVAVLVILGPILGLINSRGATPPPTTPAT